jgi:peptide/nickel transport system permease protein
MAQRDSDQTVSKEGTDDEAGVQEEEMETRVGWRYTLSQVRKDTTARIGLAVVGFWSVLAVITTIDAMLLDFRVAEALWMHPERDPSSINVLRPPYGLTNLVYPTDPGTLAHPLGTDHRGRDIMVRIIYGSRIAIAVGFISTAVGMIGGTVTGAVAGYYGGWIDDTLMRAVETLYAIPFLILVIAFMTAFGRELIFAMVGVGVAQIPSFARLIRSRVFSVREEEYVEAAEAAGVRDSRIIFRHVIPNSFAPVLVQATLQVGVAILIVAGLSFLGFGAQPPTSSWGQMLNQASSQGRMLVSPWFSVWPGMAILSAVMGFNMFGDGLRDALDPRLQN